jgi:TolB protein
MLVIACVLCGLLGSNGNNDSRVGAGPAPALVASATAGAAAGAAPTQQDNATPASAMVPATLLFPGEERHLRNVRQLTFGHSAAFDGLPYPANYAEAYWSPDGRKLVLQATRDEFACDQMFVLDLITGGMELVSTGTGRVTCGFFNTPYIQLATPEGTRIIDDALVFSSTHETLGSECPARPDMSQGYVWPLYDYDIYSKVGDSLTNLSKSPGYDAESTIDWRRGRLYFTSTRDGDIEIYSMNCLDGKDVQRLTNSFGYDGGPFISYDGETVVFRRQLFESEAEQQDYSNLLAEKLVRPNKMELWAMASDGTGQRQLTTLGGANFAPFLHPDNETLIFCSNYEDKGSGRTFELYAMPLSGGAPERITYSGEFDGFPMFSPDGKHLVWCSNRNGSRGRETNIFVAEWVK